MRKVCSYDYDALGRAWVRWGCTKANGRKPFAWVVGTHRRPRCVMCGRWQPSRLPMFIDHAPKCPALRRHLALALLDGGAQ